MRAAFLALMILAPFLGGCQLPLDPEGTTDQVQGKVLVVGLLNAKLGNADRAAITAVASEFSAAPRLIAASPDVLVADLEAGKVHLLLGDVPADTALATHAAATRDFGSVRIGETAQPRIALARVGENGFLLRVNRALGTARIRTQTAKATETGAAEGAADPDPQAGDVNGN